MLKLRRESSKQRLADMLSLQITRVKMESPENVILTKKAYSSI
jgi:hypothetical protein